LSVVGDPTAQVEWSKVDAELARDVIVDDGTMIIPYVSESHQGTYRCTTTTVLGTSYMQFILTVEGLLLFPHNCVLFLCCKARFAYMAPLAAA